MSHTAQKEDLSDASVIADFAAKVGDPRRLTALYLLTVADIRGTSPKVWNAWKGKLLEDLYRLGMRKLGGDVLALDAETEARKKEARQILALHSALPGTETPLWKTLDLSYFARHDPNELAWHARSLWRHFETTIPVVRARPSPLGEGLQVLMFAPDRSDLFARICGYFDGAGFSIQDAKIHTTNAGAGRAPGRAGGGIHRPAARAALQPRLAPREVVPGGAARVAAPRRARAALAAVHQRQRPLRPALLGRPRAGAVPHQPAARQGVHAGRARGGRLPRRRRGAAEQPAADPGGDGAAGRDLGVVVQSSRLCGT
jgi:hypothetical protein